MAAASLRESSKACALDLLHSNVSEAHVALAAGRIDEKTARRDSIEACLFFLQPDQILAAAAEALGVDISGWDMHKKRSAATVILLALSFDP
jgi:hypothetical protein